WEKKLGSSDSIWTLLEPVSATSANGATLKKLPDFSVLSTDKKPDKDVYTITARTELRGITGLRLEALTDDSLPHKGPGRQDNGNMHLNEFTVQVAAVGEP